LPTRLRKLIFWVWFQILTKRSDIEAHLDRTKKTLLILFAASIAVGWFCFDEKLSRLGDNAEFIDISKGLVTGEGMSFVHGPTPEPARKFPPGYPIILAVSQLISPDNINVMKGFSVLFFALAIPLAWLVIREIDSDLTATVTACTALLSPSLIEFSSQVLSEIPYTAVSLACILFLLKFRKSDEPKALLLLVVLAVASYYVRTIGLTAIGAVVCTQFLDRRFKHGFMMGTVAALLILPWVLMSSAYLDQFSSVNPYLIDSPEGSMISIGFLFERLFRNLDQYGLIFFPNTFAPFFGFPPPQNWASTTVAVFIDLLLLYFLIFSLRRARKEAPITVYLVLYLIVVLLWPEIWGDTRFVIPIIPLAVYAMFWSVRDLLGRLPIPPPYGRWAPYVFAALVLLANGVQSARTRINPRPYNPDWDDYFEGAEWIRDNTPADALIVCRKPFLMNVISHRTTMGYPWIASKQLVRALTTSGTDYVVSDAIFGSTQTILNMAIVDFPDNFLLVNAYGTSATRIFQFLDYEDDGTYKSLEQQLTDVNIAIEMNESDISLWRKLYSIGAMFHSHNELIRAREIYERVLPRIKQANVSLNLGILNFAEGRYKDAIVSFGAAVNRSATDADARVGLAQTYERVGKFDAAIEQAKEAHKLTPDSAPPLHIIARCAIALGQNDVAEQAFADALRVDPASIPIRNDLAFYRLRNEQYQEAYELLATLLQEAPGSAEIRINTISALTHLGRTKEARAHTGVLLTNFGPQISQAPLKEIASDVLRQLSDKLGISAEALKASAVQQSASP